MTDHNDSHLNLPTHIHGVWDELPSFPMGDKASGKWIWDGFEKETIELIMADKQHEQWKNQ
jgi:hypothetical protein